jgi:arsenical pump membrane protein
VPGPLDLILALALLAVTLGTAVLRSGVRHLLPVGASLPDLLLIAAVSAVLANLVNNLPATLILVPVAVPAEVIGATVLLWLALRLVG